MKFGELTWKEIEAIDKGKVVVLPTAALEQHGHHLPLLTDTLIVTAIAERAEAALREDILLLPTLWVGSSHHHIAMPGTMSLTNEVYVKLLRQIMECLILAGFRRIVLLNGHGGNENPGREAIYEIELAHTDLEDLWVAFGSYWFIAGDAIKNLPGFETAGITHACEYETSTILHLRADLVHLDKARAVNPQLNSDFLVADFSAASRVETAKPLHLLSETGAFGKPELGTAEKGERLLNAVVPEVVKFLREFATWPAVKSFDR